MPPPPRLMWFRSDLRVGDNRALAAACHKAEGGVVAVFVITPDQWLDHDWGPPKVWFLLESLRDLAARLESLAIPLRVLTVPRFDAVPGVLLALAREVGAGELHANAEYEVNELARDESVRDAFAGASRSVRIHHDQTAAPVHEIRTGSGGFYTVYSPFRRAWESAWRDAAGFAPVDAPRKQRAIAVASDPVPERVAGFDDPTIDRSLWPAGEKAARLRLASFLRHRADAYKDERDLPALDATSRLSPYLSLGVISPRVCIAEAIAANDGRLDSGSRGIVHFIQELMWREFYRHVLIGFPRVCRHRPFRADTESVPWRNDPPGFDAWRSARTGVPIVDAAMRQLHATGWMHNRLRMLAAMYLTKDLLIDWRLGERHFMRHLVDADLAQNNGGWQWSASTGTDAAPYFRIFNPVTQSRRFDPQARFLRAHLPELASLDDDAIHDPAPLDRQRLGYPQPIVDHAMARDRAIAAFKRSEG